MAMAARLGTLTYWTAWGIVPFWVFGSVLDFPRPVHDWPYHISVVIAGTALIWAIGRAALFVLAGK